VLQGPGFGMAISGLPFGLFETVCQKKMVWPFDHFWPLLNVDKKSII